MTADSVLAFVHTRTMKYLMEMIGMHEWTFDAELDLYKCMDCHTTMSGPMYRMLHSEDTYNV